MVVGNNVKVNMLLLLSLLLICIYGSEMYSNIFFPRLDRMIEFFERTETRTNSPNAFRILQVRKTSKKDNLEFLAKLCPQILGEVVLIF